MNGHGRAMATAALLGRAALTTAGCQSHVGATQQPPYPVRTATSSVSRTPSSTSPTSSSTSPSPTPSMAVPTPARAHTDEGAVAFATYFALQADEAYVSGDVTTIRALSSKSCEGCAVTITSVERNARQGKHQEARSFAIKEATKQGHQARAPGKDADRLGGGHGQGSAVREEDGAHDGATEAGNVKLQVGVDPVSDGWLVSEFAPVTT